MQRPPKQDQRKSRWQPPSDSDLPSVPLAGGLTLAVIGIIAAFVFIGWVGMVVLIAVLLAGLALSYRIVMGSESDS